MDTNWLIDGIIWYLSLVVLLTFHELAHAWAAWLCGDDTSRLQGRFSLNPLAHIDPIGTVLMPWLMILLPQMFGQFLIGWAKPVIFNPARLRNRWRDEMIIAMAGPAMNIVLAILFVALARVGLIFNWPEAVGLFGFVAKLSLRLCFFNLIPIPPLDGSHVMRNLSGMSYETYWRLSQWGFIGIVIVLQIPIVRQVLGFVTDTTLAIIGACFGFPSQ
jgi:Zn-dependent protease